MRFSRWLQRRALLVAVSLSLSIVGACGGGKAAPKDGGAGIGGGIGGSGVGGSAGGAGGSDGGLVGCLETPGVLDRPPAGRLPCVLVPPGLRL